MADVPVRFAGLRGALAAFAVDLFAGRIGTLTDAPMCSGGYDRWGIYDGAAWRLGVASDYAGNANVLSLRVNGTEVIDSAQNVKGTTLWSGGAIRVDANGDGMLRNLDLTGTAKIGGYSRVRPNTDGSSQLLYMDAANSNFYWNVGKDSAPKIGGDAGERWVEYAYTDAGVKIEPPVRVCDRALDGVQTFGRKTNFLRELWAWAIERVRSAQYTKATDTTIGPSATAKASLLNGSTSGFVAVSEPAGRWNAVGAQSDIRLKGKASSVANQVLVFELYRNGVSVATLTLPARTYGTNTPWRLEIDQDVRVAGASGTVRVDMRAYVTADNASSQASCYQMDSTLTGVDLTAAATWDVVCTIPNNAANSITCIKARKDG